MRASHIARDPLPVVEDIFAVAQRTHHADIAHEAFDRLYASCVNLPGNPAAERKLRSILSTRTSCLSILQRPEALKATLARLIGDPALRKRLGAEGQRRVREERSRAKTAARVRDAPGIPDEKIPYAELP